MNCREAARHLPGYLDGAIDVHVRQGLSEHLVSCGACRSEVDRYQWMSAALAHLEPVAPPEDLAVKIRIRASKAEPRCAWLGGLRDRWDLLFGNVLKPFAVPATGGVLAALAVFVLMPQVLLLGLPGGTVVDDQPLNLVQPAQVESLGPLPAPVFMSDAHGHQVTVLLDATVDAEGQAVSYKILSGPTDSGAQRQIDQVMLLSRFRPLLTFGRPTDGGHVLLVFAPWSLNFNAVRVRG